jgi:hypothetical protein
MLRSHLPGADGVTRPLWVDTAYDDAMELTTVEFGSDAYFALFDDPDSGAVAGDFARVDRRHRRRYGAAHHGCRVRIEGRGR